MGSVLMDNDNRRARLYYLFGASQTPKGSSWLERLPAGLFAIPVGLFGLAAAWRRAADSWPLAADVGNILVWTATAIWALSLLLYAAKCKRYPQAVLREFQHPVQGSLQALLPLSLLLAILHFGRSDQGIWLVLTFLALGLNALIAFRVVSVLATGQMPANAVTPALYLPLVGGALVGAMACAGLGHVSVAALLF
ncbi:MAG: hypothetical protein ACREX0_13760, partial [Noviherbaspirillum sp.]